MAVEIYKKVDNTTRILVTFLVMTGTFMAILDTTIVDVVIPKMIAPLKTDLYGVQWVITAYMAAAATGLLLIDALTRIFGLKKIFLIGIFIFTVSSITCGFAQDLTQMIVSRSFQGFGEAFIVATAQTIVFSLFPPEKKGIAMGIYGMGVSFAPALGPTVGGYLTEYFNWRYIFFVNVPVGFLVVLLGIFIIPEVLEKAKKKFSFNFLSYILFSGFTIPLLIMLSKGQEKGWFQSPLIIKLLLISIGSFIFYLIIEIISKNKLIDPRIFKSKEYTIASIIYFLTLGLSIYQIFYLLPIYYESLKGYTTLQAGLHMFAFSIFIGFTSIFAGLLSDKYGEKYVLTFNAIIYFFTSIVLIPQMNYYTPSMKTILLTIPLGFSIGSFFAPITTLAMRNLGEKTQMGVSFLQYIRFMGGSFGTALATNKLQSGIAMHYEGIGDMQNYKHVSIYLNRLIEKLSNILNYDLAVIKSKILLGKVQSLMSASYSFQDTFRHAGYFGMLGLSFLLFLYFPLFKKKNGL